MHAPTGSERTLPPPTFAGVTILLALGAGALACVLAGLPYRSFDLHRVFAPKELALHAAARASGLAALASARRMSLTRADHALVVWLLLSAASALFATNHWLADRALPISVSAGGH